MQLFLLGIANRLKLDTPSSTFDWRSVDAQTCLENTLAVLISQIEYATTVDRPAADKPSTSAELLR